MAPDVDLEAIEIRLFLEAIHAKYGYDFRGYAPSSIRRRVLLALAKSGLAHLGELQHRVLSDAGVFTRVLEDMTVRVSAMFRDPASYLAFRTRVVPILRACRTLKIWHVGCAGGEEVYANAIVLTEEGLYERAQIYATDMSPRALEQAKLGVYAAEHFAAFTDNYEKAGGAYALTKYCTRAYDQIAIHESLRRNISFFQHDLVSDHVFGEMNVVFCRNVLIYFGETLRDLAVRRLSQSLCPGGFLFLGHGERLAASGTRIGLREFAPDARMYRADV
jgi:chemotaxis protein methyltransferase CheR